MLLTLIGRKKSQSSIWLREKKKVVDRLAKRGCSLIAEDVTY